jgi:hypothetical protein
MNRLIIIIMGGLIAKHELTMRTWRRYQMMDYDSYAPQHAVAGCHFHVQDEVPNHPCDYLIQK